ncbi:MAG: hypothetical protein ACI8XU_002518, partial [Kiritimatiellia bacterium]
TNVLCHSYAAGINGILEEYLAIAEKL